MISIFMLLMKNLFLASEASFRAVSLSASEITNVALSHVLTLAPLVAVLVAVNDSLLSVPFPTTDKFNVPLSEP